MIIVGGHLDSWDLATGATDNGLGLLLASWTWPGHAGHAGSSRARTVRFVLFMGEEQGLLGSRALVAHYRSTRRTGEHPVHGEPGHERQPAGLRRRRARTGWTERIDGGHAAPSGRWTAPPSPGEVAEHQVWLHSDHQPFLLAGVPVIYPLSDLGKHVYGCYHSSCDDIHLVDPQAMVNNVRFMGMLVYRAGGHATPFRRISRDDRSASTPDRCRTGRPPPDRWRLALVIP